MPIPRRLQDVASLLARLPGIGEKSAYRIVFHIITQQPWMAKELGKGLYDLIEQLKPCEICGAISDESPCLICLDDTRDRSLLCVVEEPEHIITIEKSGVFKGLYHVLGGHISPIDGKKGHELRIDSLKKRLAGEGIIEMIVATNPRVEGDMTFYYLLDECAGYPVIISKLASGLPVGGELKYADRLTLHVALEGRQRVK